MKYQYLHRTHSDSIDNVNEIFETVLGIEIHNDIHVLKGAEKIQHAEAAGVMDMLFVLQLLWGKWEMRDDVLHGIKITIPLISSTMHYQQTVEQMIQELRDLDIVIKMDIIELDDGLIIQLSSRDMCLLEQFSRWYKPLATWSVISTKDFTQSLVNSLEEFVGEEISLDDNQIIKIGAVQ